jgi:transposase
VQDNSGQQVTLAYAEQGYKGEAPAEAAAAQSIHLLVVNLGQTKRGFVLFPRRWVVERSLSWSARYKRLAHDYERLALNLQQFHYHAFVGFMLAKAYTLHLWSITGSSSIRRVKIYRIYIKYFLYIRGVHLSKS